MFSQRKVIKVNKRKISIVIIIAFVIISAVIYKNREDYHIAREYSAEKWMNSQMNDRYLLMDDFFDKYNLVDMKIDDVYMLLGEYDVMQEAYISEKGLIDYHIGYIIRKDKMSGYEVLLLDIKDSSVISYKMLYLGDL